MLRPRRERVKMMASGAAGTPIRISPLEFRILVLNINLLSAFLCIFLSGVVLVWVSMHFGGV